MNSKEPRTDLDSPRDCSLKIVSDNVFSWVSKVEIPENESPKMAEQESRCQNGVCPLNWKPRRAA
jgi:hypothetical protein